jgi:ABC-type uncharacterized transport system permease subunit
MSEEVGRSLAVFGTAIAMFAAGLVLWLSHRLFQEIRKESAPEAWKRLGSPGSLMQALSDSERRWHKFMRSKEYRTSLPITSVKRIEMIRRVIFSIYIALALFGGFVAFVVWVPSR